VQNPAVNELPAYLIHVTPSIQIDGIDVAVGTSAPLATDQRWRMTLLTEWKESSSLRDFSVTAGSELVFGVNGGVVAESQIANRMSSTPTNSAAENLHLNALHYWFEHYLFSKLAAIQRGVSYQPISAFGLFSAPVETTSSLFGISRNAAYRGRSLDIPHLLSAVSADTARQRFGFGRLLGGQASLLEGAVSEQLFGRQYGQGVSAVRLLNDANAQGIPIFAISSLNASAAMPQLQIGARAYADIENALANGKSIFVSQRTPEHFKYTGIGYVIEDPTDGAGAYLIDGGLNGGAMPDCACERVKVPVAQLVYGIIMTIIILAILAGLTGLTGGLDTPAKAAELAALMAMFGLTALFFPVNAQASNATPPACCFTPGGDCDKPDLFRGGSASEPQLWKVRLNRGPGFDDDVGYVPNGIEVPSPTTCRTATPEILALQVIADGRGISLDENPRPVPWRLPIDQYPSASLCLIKDGRTHWSLGPKFPMSYGELCDLLDAERFKFVRF
jgi:hypothetical protein